MKIIQEFIAKGRRNRPGHPLIARWITIHDTGNTAITAHARNHAKYLRGNVAAALRKSWHFTVDDTEIYQHLPLTESGFHAGDGDGPGNRTSIGIEICENKGIDRTRAEANAAWLTAGLLTDHKLGIEAVVQHNRWSGKNCPRILRGRPGGWAGFLEAVNVHLPSAKPGPLPSVTRRIAIFVNGKRVAQAGYLIGNTTYIPAAFAVTTLAKGTITGHGDHIKISI